MKDRKSFLALFRSREWTNAIRRFHTHRYGGRFRDKPESLTISPTSATVLFSWVLLLGAFALSGCDSDDSQAPFATELADADALLIPSGALSDDMVGQTVTVTGKIVEQCPASGCWFRIETTAGATFVDLLSS